MSGMRLARPSVGGGRSLLSFGKPGKDNEDHPTRIMMIVGAMLGNKA